MSDASLVSQGAGKKLSYPHEAPENGATLEIAPGIHWFRQKLPFHLDHINLWLLEDGDGWTVIDTGVQLDESKKAWRNIFETTMGGRPVKRVIVTHLHPDHVGLAGWIAKKHQCRLWMSRTDYLTCRTLWHDTGPDVPEDGIQFYRAAGFNDEHIERYKSRFGFFGHGVSRMPDSYRRIKDEEVITIGKHEWRVVMGSGHAPEHVCLWCEELDLFISGDQVLPRISSNVSVHPTEPDGDPLTDWINSCKKLRDIVPDSVLVCPSHQRCFHGLHARLGQLIDGHERNLNNLLKSLAEPKRSIDVFGALYKRAIGEELLGMATGEAIAHLNCLLSRGLATRTADEAGINWYQATS